MNGGGRGRGWSAAADWTAEGDGLKCGGWYALVASRLGRHVEQRREFFQLVMYGALRARRDGAALLIVDGTAPAAWVQRAAELVGVPVVRVRTTAAEDRDAALIALADRVFALWVRRGGKIQRLLQQRLSRQADAATVWAAVTGRPDCGGADLVRSGAVGWIVPGRHGHAGTDVAGDVDTRQGAARATGRPPQAAAVIPPDAVPWDRFLVHCTRARDGALPGQSLTRWRDEVLLGGRDGQPASAAEVLVRILDDGWIHGNIGLTRGDQPVVCLADVPLPQLLGRRTFRPHLGRWDYEPYGVAVRRRAIRRVGGRAVVYGSDADCRRLPPQHRWRFQAVGKTFDWRTEREWRLRGSLDLTALGTDDAVVFVENDDAAALVAAHSRWPVVVTGRFSAAAL